MTPTEISERAWEDISTVPITGTDIAEVMGNITDAITDGTQSSGREESK